MEIRYINVCLWKIFDCNDCYIRKITYGYTWYKKKDLIEKWNKKL